MLCIRSILTHYQPQKPINLIVDDMDQKTWTSYASDLKHYLAVNFPDVEFSIKVTSDIPWVHDPNSGWWRQQLIKLCVDRLLPGSEWFVVDGDVIFCEPIMIRDVIPISRRIENLTRPISVLGMNYVRQVLGIEQGHLTENGNYILTNPIPFRVLQAQDLQDLRTHVESRFQKDFCRLHIDWILEQTIVAYEDPPTRMIMTEWELLECFKFYVKQLPHPLIEIGNGYQLDVDLDTLVPETPVYLHSYHRDGEIGAEWFRSQEISVPEEIFAKVYNWSVQHEPYRLKS